MPTERSLTGIDTGLSYDDVLLVPQRSPVSSRSNVSLETNLTESIQLDHPIVSAPMDTVTESHLAQELADTGGVGVIHRFMPPEEQLHEVKSVKNKGYQVGAAIGLNEDYMSRARVLLEQDLVSTKQNNDHKSVDFLVFDIAHAHLEDALTAVRELSDLNVPLIAGNVATPSGVMDLAEAGADAIKVGVGPGGFCTTRVVSGAGVPQLTAVDECSSAAPESVCIIADGGIRASGDAVKALMAGADTVMMGTFFAGTQEAAGTTEDGDSIVNHARGMASQQANEDRTDKEDATPNVAEGIQGTVEVSSTVKEKTNEFLAGIRSGISYCGGQSILEAREKAQFIRVTPDTVKRNGAHYNK